jgi:phosphomannomutase
VSGLDNIAIERRVKEFGQDKKEGRGETMAGIFKAYDIRGLYPHEIDENIAERIGYAYAEYLDGQNVIVGYDMRMSSRPLAEAFMNGVMFQGTNIRDIGLATTPMLYSAIIDGDFDGGAMITASHLPGDYNGIKLCREKAIPLSGEDGLHEVEALYKARTNRISRNAHFSFEAYLEQYLEDLCGFILPSEGLKIVVDAGNGMGGLDSPQVFRKYPNCEFVPMYMQPDGNFPHHIPNPALPSSTVELQKQVVSEHADLGIAFDGDCDRCGFVDENGERIPADLIVAILAEYFLEREPGATILYDLRASRVVPERIKALGGKPVKTRVGHSFIKQRMREANAVFAGELSGHYYFREAGFIDSGILSMISMINLLSMKRTPISQLVRPFQKYARSGEINFKVKDAQNLFQELKTKYQDGKQDHLDGLTVEYEDWWFNLRVSHTEPVVRLVMEASEEEKLLKEKSNLMRIIHPYEQE